MRRIARDFESPVDEGASQLATYWVGQGVGLMNQSKSVKAVVQEFKEEYIAAHDRLAQTLSE